MEGGDISNDIAPRMIFVFEGVIGELPGPMAAAREKAALKAHRWGAAVKCWQISDRADMLLWDVAWRWNYRFSVVTYRPAGFAGALELRLNEENLPFSTVWATTPETMAKRMAFMPDVSHVFDSDPARLFTYGDRGHYLPGGLAAAESLW